ncbi:MAG: glycosyl hydrolase family 28 protein [Verrucomicrobiae bacterium]|nr:glycosyl hydrolase family 28 protein [Verrucomicrobiae bacterium]
MKNKLFLLAALLAFQLPLPAKDFNVLDFGAKGDGVTVDTAAIQRAIDAAAAGTNGRVVIPYWKQFLVGTLQLRSGIDFHLNGELIISTNPADYSGDGVIMALEAANLKITGGGRISGRSLEFMTSYDAAGEWWLFREWRPKMFVLTGCTNLVVRDITFGDAPFWGLHMLGCEKVLVDNVTVRNRLDVPNDDGIDPDHCRNVEIRDCDLVCGDDAIVIKSTRQTNDFGACANIRVHDCVIRTQDAGLKIGTETTGDIHDIVFERCKILSGSRGLCIQLRDEGEISNITFRDIKFTARYHSDPWWGRGEAISFTAHPRNPGGKVGKLHDVLVQNVSGKAENSVRINGSEGSRIQNVRLENVAVSFARWTRYAGEVYDNRPTKGLLPVEPHATDGFNVRFADNISLSHCTANWASNAPAYFQSSVAADGSASVKITGFKGESDRHPITLK